MIKKNSTISISFVGDAQMQKLNKKYKGKNCPTDVLSFEISEGMLLGEVLVNLDQAKRQATDYKNSFEEEVAELVEHGVLHLLGVHHGKDK